MLFIAQNVHFGKHDSLLFGLYINRVPRDILICQPRQFPGNYSPTKKKNKL